MVARWVLAACPAAIVAICHTAAVALLALQTSAFDLAIVDVILCGDSRYSPQTGSGRDVAGFAASNGARTVLTSSHSYFDVAGAGLPGVRFMGKDTLNRASVGALLH